MAALLLVSGVVTMMLWPERETTAQRNLQLPGANKLLAPSLVTEKIVAPSPHVQPANDVINDTTVLPEVPPSEEAPSDVFNVASAPSNNSVNQIAAQSDDSPVEATPQIAPLGHSGTYVLQVSSESDDATAQALAHKLRERGHTAFVVRANNEERGTTWRVRIGPFDYRRDALKYRTLLEEKEDMTSFVVRTADEL